MNNKDTIVIIFDGLIYGDGEINEDFYLYIKKTVSEMGKIVTDSYFIKNGDVGLYFIIEFNKENAQFIKNLYLLDWDITIKDFTDFCNIYNISSEVAYKGSFIIKE